MKCEWPEGITIKPDGIHSLDPCVYMEIERFSNVTVSINKCIYCGHVEVSWFRQEDTEEIDIES